MNVGIVLVKLAAYAASGALSIVAEVLHSSLDAVNNVFALWFAGVAGREPDERHPYGHQKFETLGALALVGLLSVTVFELLRGAAARLTSPTPPSVEASPLAFGLMAFGVVAGTAIARYESRLGRSLGSDLLLADAAHTRSDVLTTLAVLAGLVLVRMGYPRVDPIVTIAVAGAIAWTGWRIVREAVPVLVDERAVAPERIRELAEVDARVLSCYRVRSRGRPGEVFAEVTIAVPASMDVAESHAVADGVEERVSSALGAREVLVHVEPGD
jgi:cation diffusion facilitator family transporter